MDHRRLRARSEGRSRSVEAESRRRRMQGSLGWRLRWAEVTAARTVVPGPFGRARLLEPIACCRSRSDGRVGLRSGIPDPWLEYQVWRERPDCGEAQMDRLKARLTDYVCNERGLPMLQGIPDPWRSDMCYVSCDETTRKKKERCRYESNGCGVRKKEVTTCVLSKFNSGFNELNRKLTKLEKELRQKCTDKERKYRELVKSASGRKKDSETNKKDLERSCDTDESCASTLTVSLEKSKRDDKERKTKKLDKSCFDYDEDNRDVAWKEETLSHADDEVNKRMDFDETNEAAPRPRTCGWLCSSPRKTSSKPNIKSRQHNSAAFTSFSEANVTSRTKRPTKRRGVTSSEIKLTTDVLKSLDLSEETPLVRKHQKENDELKDHARSAFRKNRAAGDNEMNNALSELFTKRPHNGQRDRGDSVEVVELSSTKRRSDEDLIVSAHDEHRRWKSRKSQNCANESARSPDLSLRIESLSE